MSDGWRILRNLLYAGCMKAALNYSKESNIAITEEVSLKFGKDKIVACVMDDSDITGNEAVLEEFVHSVILLNERTIKQAVSLSRRPLIVSLPEVSLDKIIELLSCENIEGITGPAVNANARELMDIKDLCAGNGVAVRTFEPVVKWDELKKNSDGLVPVIVQDYKPGGFDDGLHERGSLFEHPKERTHDLLQPQPRLSMAEGGNQRPFPACEGNDGGL